MDEVQAADPGPMDRIGDGKSQVMVGPERGRVIMAFPNPITWVAYDPQNAVQIAKAMIDAAQSCGYEVSLQLPRKEVSQLLHDTLVQRVALVIPNQLEKNTPIKTLAYQIVDIILSAAT